MMNSMKPTVPTVDCVGAPKTRGHDSVSVVHYKIAIICICSNGFTMSVVNCQECYNIARKMRTKEVVKHARREDKANRNDIPFAMWSIGAIICTLQMATNTCPSMVRAHVSCFDSSFIRKLQSRPREERKLKYKMAVINRVAQSILCGLSNDHTRKVRDRCMTARETDRAHPHLFVRDSKRFQTPPHIGLVCLKPKR